MVVTRRQFVQQSATCAGHIALAAAVSPAWMRALWAAPTPGAVVAREPFGSLERVADNAWALISTPLSGDRTTLSNGGIIAGRNAVLAIEGFNQPAGAAWLAGKARELTGRWPTHVAVTHYHSDHSNGVAGYMAAADHPVMRATTVTRELILGKNTADADRAAALKDVVMIDGENVTSLDLGGRTAHFVPRAGHTASDIAIALDDPSLVFCGDLVWNGMVPNYVDAMPTQLAKSVAGLRRARPTTYVPGHGAVAHEADFDRYVAMLQEIEKGARAAKAAGKTAAEAGKEFKLPASLGEWVLFSPAFFERAFSAWFKELA
jgi:glyoxylase-like metal-dependent hydrolase (beta-lactamase superfamily II)